MATGLTLHVFPGVSNGGAWIVGGGSGSYRWTGGNEGNILLCIVLIKVYHYLWPLNPPFWFPQEQVKCVSVFKDGNHSHSGLFKLTFEKKTSQRETILYAKRGLSRAEIWYFW